MTNDYKKTGSELTRDVSNIPHITEKEWIHFRCVILNAGASGMWRPLVWYKFTETLEKPTAFVYSIQETTQGWS